MARVGGFRRTHRVGRGDEMKNARQAPDNGEVWLTPIDEHTLEALLSVAVAETEPEEVMPPFSAPAGSSQLRRDLCRLLPVQLVRSGRTDANSDLRDRLQRQCCRHDQDGSVERAGHHGGRGTIATRSDTITGSRSMPSIGCTAMTNPTSARPDCTTSYCSAKVTSRSKLPIPGAPQRAPPAGRPTGRRYRIPVPQTTNDQQTDRPAHGKSGCRRLRRRAGQAGTKPDTKFRQAANTSRLEGSVASRLSTPCRASGEARGFVHRHGTGCY
jgi:hypothetical protein